MYNTGWVAFDEHRLVLPILLLGHCFQYNAFETKVTQIILLLQAKPKNLHRLRWYRTRGFVQASY